MHHEVFTVIGTKIKLCKSMIYRVKMWYLQESNQGHKDFQSFALPTELRYPAFKQVQI